ncbi:MAG TPA: hypothetical protein VF627_10025 [Abditibacterium sp.]|jgi:hypothetical protein
MSKPSQVFILGEDANKAQQNLIRKYLKKRGFSDRQIRDLPCPVGETPGISFVLSDFAKQVHNLRVATSSKGLIVAIDADEETVATRKSQLEEKLRTAGEAARGEQEAIAIVVPKRNVETWIWYLEGNAVDETSNYKKSSVSGNHDMAEAKRAFADFIVSGQVPFEDCPPSLEDARIELLRIPHS